MSYTVSFDWKFKVQACKYQLPKLEAGTPPPVAKGCEIIQSSAYIIPPYPPTTKPLPSVCAGAFGEKPTSRLISDSQQCSKCPGFPGYPPTWPPPSASDSRYGNNPTETWQSNGSKAEGKDFSYEVKWTRVLQCKVGSSWGMPKTETVSVWNRAKWIIECGTTTAQGTTRFECNPIPYPYYLYQ